MKYIVYHCTNSKFDNFNKQFIGTASDMGIWGRGFYFGNKPNDAYGKITYKCLVEIKNPFIINNFKSVEEISDYLNVSESNFRLSDGIIYFAQDQIRQITSHIQDKGHDGIIVKLSPQWTEYVVFSSKQIKILNEEGITENLYLDLNHIKQLNEKISCFLPSHKKFIGRISESLSVYNSLGQKINNPEDINEQKSYHGTNAYFDKFDVNKFQRGDYGYGIYFTHSKRYASDYGNVKQYEIPDDEYLLSWEDTWNYQSDYVYDCLDKLFDDLYDHNRDAWEKIMEIVDRGYGNDGEGLYYNISEILRLSPKQVSELLYKYGIKGIDSFKGNCQVIFNPDDVKPLSDVSESRLSELKINSSAALEFSNFSIESIRKINETLEEVLNNYPST